MLFSVLRFFAKFAILAKIATIVGDYCSLAFECPAMFSIFRKIRKVHFKRNETKKKRKRKATDFRKSNRVVEGLSEKMLLRQMGRKCRAFSFGADKLRRCM